MKHLSSTTLTELRQALENTRDRLIDDQTTLKAEAREVETNSNKESAADVATDSFARDQELGEAALDQRTLDEILAALQRLDAGTYGICELTGQPIPEERLRAIPWTRHTREAEEQVEARSGPHRLIGDIGSLD